jgi:SnoaL-like domain
MTDVTELDNELNEMVLQGKAMEAFEMDVTFKGGGRVKMEQVTGRVWNDEKVVSERFYYNAG